jgi:hypothetical protein
MSSTPYPFAASPSNSGSDSRPPVHYPRLQQQQAPAANSLSASISSPGHYALAPSNSPSTVSLLPVSARGPPVQATFAQGPKTTLRRSNSDTVRRYPLVDDNTSLTTTIGDHLNVHFILQHASRYDTGPAPQIASVSSKSISNKASSNK